MPNTKKNLAKQKRFKCLLLGDAGVGKSTYLLRLATGLFQPYHVPGNEIRVHTLRVETNYRGMALQIWDFADITRYRCINMDYLMFAKCAIIMFDLTKPQSALNVKYWLRIVTNVCGPELPIVICGNKAELERMPPILICRNQRNLDYCELSTKGAWNLFMPLNQLCRRLLNYHDVKLISLPIIFPSEDCNCDMEKMLQQMLSVVQKPTEGNDEDAKYKTGEIEDFTRYIILNRS